ncbi:hypothetical protein HBH73_245940 [Parastagonospora nodorum]|nr:hypothetical protein HBH73_245940 [Parastagonospora nodorum]
MHSHNQLVAEYNTAQITIRDLDARIAAIASKRTNVNTIAAKKDSRFKKQITALKIEKNMLNTENADLRGDRNELKQDFTKATQYTPTATSLSPVSKTKTRAKSATFRARDKETKRADWA